MSGEQPDGEGVEIRCSCGHRFQVPQWIIDTAQAFRPRPPYLQSTCPNCKASHRAKLDPAPA